MHARPDTRVQARQNRRRAAEIRNAGGDVRWFLLRLRSVTVTLQRPLPRRKEVRLRAERPRARGCVRFLCLCFEFGFEDQSCTAATANIATAV